MEEHKAHAEKREPRQSHRPCQTALAGAMGACVGEVLREIDPGVSNIRYSLAKLMAKDAHTGFGILCVGSSTWERN